jgi:rubrerythrin
MKQEILEHIARCFAEASRAASRAEAFALLAEKDGRSGLGRLFRAVAHAESVRADRFGHLMRGKIGSTDENLREVLETARLGIRDYEEMIPDVKAAETGGAVRKGFIQSKRAREEVVTLTEGALSGEEPDGDLDYFVCGICGHIHLRRVPERCPVCGAVPGRFRRVDRTS